MPVLDRKFHSPHHHRHPLILMEFNSRYKCDGCKDPGLHSGYCCDRVDCNFVLHEQCMENFGDHFRFNRFFGRELVFVKRLEFIIKGTKEVKLAICDVCAKPINSYAYAEKTRDGHRSVNVHPLCATLSRSICNGELNLVSDIKSDCFWCHQRHLPDVRHNWAYISTTERISIHIGCIKEIFSEYSKGRNIFGGTLLAVWPNKHHRSIPSSTAIVLSAGPSSSKSNAIKPRKIDKIKKKAKAIGHAVAAVLGPLSKIVSLGAAIAALIPLL